MGFLNRCFRCSGRLVCYIKRRKSFIGDLFSPSMTWESRGLPGITGDYKALQGVTGGDKGLQGITKDYRNFLLISTFPDTFSWSIFCIKIKVEEISNF